MNIENEMSRVGRIIAADQNLEVAVRGSSAYATPGKIVIPNIEEYDRLGSKAHRLLHALIDHECGHARFTDFDVVGRAHEESPLLKEMLNVLEDVHIERAMASLYPGSGQNLAFKNRTFWSGTLHQSGITTLAKGEGKLIHLLLLATTFQVRVHGGVSNSVITSVNPVVGEILATAQPEFQELLSLPVDSEATGQILKISRRVLAKFLEAIEELREKPEEADSSELVESGEGEDTPTQKDDEESSESEQGGDVEGDEGDEDEQEPGESQSSDAEDLGDPKESGGGEIEQTIELDLTPHKDTDEFPSVEHRVVQMIDKLRQEKGDDYRVFSHEGDQVIDMTESHLLPKWSAKFNSLFEQTTEAVGPLVSAFATALLAQTYSREVAGHDEGIVDVQSLAAYSVGALPSDQIFMQKAKQDATDVAVAVLVDCSGSMGNGSGSAADLARVATLAMSRALMQAQIEHEVTAFTTARLRYFNRDYVREDQPFAISSLSDQERERRYAQVKEFQKCVRSAEEREPHVRYARSPSVPLYAVLKRFGSRDQRAISEICGFANNLDGEAVQWQARRLAARPEKRRVMFVLSDGYPAGGYDRAADREFLKRSVKRAIDSGVEVYGIGIDSDAVRHFYPVSWVCNSLQELATVGVKALTEILVLNRQERECVAC